MKLLLDQGLPRSAAQLLCEAGHDAVHVAGIGLARAADNLIMQRAVAEGRIIVTLDADFSMLLALSQATMPSVIRIREEGLTAGPMSAVILAVTKQYAVELAAGTTISVRSGKIRAHKLPITGSK